MINATSFAVKVVAKNTQPRQWLSLGFWPHKSLPIGLGITILNLGFLLLPGVVAPKPALSAERLYITYGPLEFSLPVSELETYAKEGKIEGEFTTYSRYLKPKQLEQLQRLLTTRANLSPVAVSQFLYSPQGEILLQRVGEVIQTKASQPGFYAIRAALIQAAADPQGFTLLNVLKKFPTYGIRINSERGFEIVDQLTTAIRQNQSAIAAVETQSLAEASAQPSVNFSQLPDLRQPGSITWTKQTFTLNDVKRQRVFPVDLYLPELGGKAASLIVISHGLGDNRTTFAYLAKHLASYGFAVAVPEHPGSDSKRVQQLLSGLVREVSPPREFIDRPLDVKYLLDYLATSFKGQLNLQQVGVIGQSFGGYTVLALTGAQLNFQQLQADCLNSESSLNVSLLLQCRALLLPPSQYQLSDPRVKAAIAINPVDSSLFGQVQLSQIKTPLMIVAGSADTVTPPLPEQLQPFTWLTTANKYLVVMEQGTHFSTLEESANKTGAVQLPVQVLGPDPTIAFGYIKALSIAFCKTYVANEPSYLPYLSAAYAQEISDYLMPLNLVQSLTPSQLSGENPPPTPEPSPSPKP